MNGMTEGDERALAFCLFSQWLIGVMEEAPWSFAVDKGFEEKIRFFSRSKEEFLTAKKHLPEQIRDVFIWRFAYGRHGCSCLEYNPSKHIDWWELVDAYKKAKERYGVDITLFCEVWCNLPNMKFPVRPALKGWFSARALSMDQCAGEMYWEYHMKRILAGS